MINNFKKLEKFLDFSEEGTFYFVQIYKRRKDNPGLYTDMYVVNNYYIYSLEQYWKLEEDIIAICEALNARAYIRLNRRDSRQVAFRMLNKLSTLLTENKFRDAKAVYTAACGEVHYEHPKKWIVDIDNTDITFCNQVVETIVKLQESIKDNSYKVLDVIGSKNGFHIITNPFNVNEFKKAYPEIDIQKDNPTILYAK